MKTILHQCMHICARLRTYVATYVRIVTYIFYTYVNSTMSMIHIYMCVYTFCTYVHIYIQTSMVKSNHILTYVHCYVSNNVHASKNIIMTTYLCLCMYIYSIVVNKHLNNIRMITQCSKVYW